jgi:hypothetical protein
MQDKGQDKGYTKISDNLFTSEIMTPDGPLYFGMELVTEENLEQASTYAEDNNSLVTQFADRIKDCFEGEMKKKAGQMLGWFEPAPDQVLESLKIKNRDNVSRLLNTPSSDTSKSLFKNSYGSNGACTKLGEQLSSISTASEGFSVSDSGKSYITYISSEPIPENGLFTNLLPGYEDAEEFDEYIDKEHKSVEHTKYFCTYMKENYGHIIMSVASNLGSKGSDDLNFKDGEFENRGILRMPISILEGNYKGTAMALHGFSALIAENEFGKTSMKVRAMNAMQGIITNSVPQEAFLHLENKDRGDSIAQIKIGAVSKCFLDAKNKSHGLEKNNTNEQSNSWESRTNKPEDPDKPKGTGYRSF